MTPTHPGNRNTSIFGLLARLPRPRFAPLDPEAGSFPVSLTGTEPRRDGREAHGGLPAILRGPIFPYEEESATPETLATAAYPDSTGPAQPSPMLPTRRKETIGNPTRSTPEHARTRQ